MENAFLRLPSLQNEHLNLSKNAVKNIFTNMQNIIISWPEIPLYYVWSIMDSFYPYLQLMRQCS
jgi:hypothetical protein